ncbi:hypothetical protein I4U23_022815 [Adineta vaga]|nr:hypothetical protein I4U23_022815 [Adineta vaga]
MVEATAVFRTTNAVILLIIIILTIIYLLPTILVRHFHTTNNILTGNICLTTIIAAVFWTIYNILNTYYENILNESTTGCVVSIYFPGLVNCLVVYAMAMISINRFCAVIYPSKALFKRLTWSFISSGTQWIIAIILAVPHLLIAFQTCLYGNLVPYWISFYNMFIIAILPCVIHVVFNSFIFINVRSSTRRVHAETTATSVTNKSRQHNTRDVRLLKHMLFIFVVFISGWSPFFILSTISINAPEWINSLLQMLPVFSLLINIVDLFLYNHDLRQYLKGRFWNRNLNK